jgi:hypothetical protein
MRDEDYPQMTQMSARTNQRSETRIQSTEAESYHKDTKALATPMTNDEVRMTIEARNPNSRCYADDPGFRDQKPEWAELTEKGIKR